MFEKLGNPYPDTHMGDFMYYVADMFAGPVQSGMRTGLCDFISTVDLEDDPLTALGQYGKQVVDMFGYEASNIRNNTVLYDSASRPWSWQVCTEFGWF